MILAVDIFDLISDLLPMILVVVVGLLTLLKRALERLFGPPSPPRRPPPPVLEEMRRYIEALEGRPGAPARPRPPSPRARPVVVEVPPPPPATPEPPPPEAVPAGLTAVAFTDVSQAAAAVTAVKQELDLTAADLREGHRRAGQEERPLRRLRLRPTPRGVRTGILWAVVLGPPRGLFFWEGDPWGAAYRYL